MWSLLDGLVFLIVEFVDGFSDSGVSTERPPQVFLFVLVIAMKNDLLLFLTIRKDAFPLVKSDILFLEDFDNLVHLISVLEVKEKASFWVDEISSALFWNECKWKSILHGDAVFQSEWGMTGPVHGLVCFPPFDIIIFLFCLIQNCHKNIDKTKQPFHKP